MSKSEIEAARRKLIDAGRILAHQGHGDMTRGHVEQSFSIYPGTSHHIAQTSAGSGPLQC